MTEVIELGPLAPCPFCGAPVRMYYDGSSDWVADCTGPPNECGASITFWVRATSNEPAEAARRWNLRNASADRLLRALVNHWHEFGPEHGLDEMMDAAHRYLTAGVTSTALPEFSMLTDEARCHISIKTATPEDTRRISQFLEDVPIGMKAAGEALRDEPDFVHTQRHCGTCGLLLSACTCELEKEKRGIQPSEPWPRTSGVAPCLEARLQAAREQFAADYGVPVVPATKEDFPYTRTFNAIAAAAKLANGGTAIGISVQAFIDAWNAHSAAGVAAPDGQTIREDTPTGKGGQ